MIPGYGPLSGFRANAPELEAYFGSYANGVWRPDPAYVTSSGGLVSSILDRLNPSNSARAVVQATTASKPTLVTSSPVFGGLPAISEGGAGQLHGKRIMCADASVSLAAPYARYCVYALTATPTSTTWLWGTSNSTRWGEVNIEATGHMRWYNTASGSLSAQTPTMDVTSRLAHCAITSPHDNASLLSKAWVIRSDGKIVHTAETAYMGSATGIASGTLSLMSFGYTTNQGFPGMMSEFGQISRRLDNSDFAKFIPYLRRQGFVAPAKELLLTGNSLMANFAQTYQGWVLPNTHVSWMSADGGYTTPQVTAAMQARTERTCGYATQKTAVLCEITNDIVAGTSAADCITHVRDWCAAARAMGCTKLAVSTVLDRPFSTAQRVVRDAVDSDLVANRASYDIDILVNLHTADAIDGQTCPAGLLDRTNLTYFQADQTHLTAAAGYPLFQAQFVNQLVAIGQ
jgi:hypothetical protein